MNRTSMQSELGKWIKKIRNLKKITQWEVSEKSGINPSHLCDIENGKYTPRLSTLDALIHALDADYEDVYVIYLDLLNTEESCYEFTIRCLQLGNVELSKASMKKLFQISHSGKMDVDSMDFIVVFVDK